MTRFARKVLKFLLSLVLYWLTGMLLLCSGSVATVLLKNRNVLASLAMFAAGLVIFNFYKFKAIYIIGHETTHWMIAKLFLRDTGKMKISWNKGFVEIDDANVWITLAPYILPFYTLCAAGFFGISQIFWYPSSTMVLLIFSCIAGLTYAYHVVMTIYALRLAQPDLDVYGSFFSISLILAGNSMFMLLIMLAVSEEWRRTASFFSALLSKQWELLQLLF